MRTTRVAESNSAVSIISKILVVAFVLFAQFMQPKQRKYLLIYQAPYCAI